MDHLDERHLENEAAPESIRSRLEIIEKIPISSVSIYFSSLEKRKKEIK